MNAEFEIARDFVRRVDGGDRQEPGPEVVNAVAEALTRKEELDDPARDEFGNWEPRGPVIEARASQPWLDQLVGARPRRGRWPEDRPFALCLTHDVDGVSGRNHAKKFLRRLRRALTAQGPRSLAVKQAAGSVYRLLSGMNGADPLAGFDEWITIEARHGYRSTWFFLPERYAAAHVYDMDYAYGDRVVFDGRRMSTADMMREVARRGWEVGLHGSYLSARRLDLLVDQKHQVEEAAGVSIRSIRQHYLCYDPAVTPRLHAEAGFRVDSTQGFNFSPGFRAGTAFPYWCWDAARREAVHVLEIPCVLMESALFQQRRSLDEARSIAVSILEAVEAVGGCLTLNWHPNYLRNADYWALYTELLSVAHERGAWGGSAGDVYDVWTAT